MAITSIGYQATVGEPQWPAAAPTFGGGRGVVGETAFQAVLTGDPDTTTTVTVKAGSAHGDGIYDTLDADTAFTFGRPSSGTRYDCLVLRRNWGTSTTTLEVVTGGANRIVPALQNNPGDITEQPLALVTVPSEGGAVVSDDLRVSWAPTGQAATVTGMRTAPVGSRFVLDGKGERYTVYPDGPGPDWEPDPPKLPDIPFVASGTTPITTNTNGYATIYHNLGFKPSTVLFDAGTTEASRIVRVYLSAATTGAVTNTTFAVLAKERTATGWKQYVGNLSQVSWIATGTPPTPVAGTVTPPLSATLPDPEPVTITTEGSGPATGPDLDVAPTPQVPLPQTPPMYLVSAPTVSSVSSILATAANEIGYTESPAGSNKTKYWVAEYPAGNGLAWCACFVKWVFRKNGISVGQYLGGTAAQNPYLVKNLWTSAKAKGLTYTGVPRPGDLAIFYEPAKASTNPYVHVEIVEKWISSTGRVQCIGGNTSLAGQGSLSNGGGVYRNQRNPKGTTRYICGYIKMPTAVPTDLQVRGPFPLPSGHWFGVADSTTTMDHNGVADNSQGVKQIQAEVGVVIDGVYGPATAAAVKAWQAAQFRTQTGRVYAEDWNVFMGVYKAPAVPTNVRATAGVKSVTVTFTGSNGAQQYTATTSSGIQATAAASPITINGLTPGVPVTVTVAASNVGGASAQSAPTGILWPTEGTLQTITLLDGSVFPVTTGSSAFGDLIGTVTTKNGDATTFNAFTSAFPQVRFLPGAQQAARNIAAVLYGTTPPASRPEVTFSFTNGTFFARTTSQTALLEFGRGIVGATNTASYVTHELVHLFQKSSAKYGSVQDVTGTIEGIADYVLVRVGHHGKNTRPAGGGTVWNAGYDTTAWFFHYIAHDCPNPTPTFVQQLNAQMSDTWDATGIKTINSRGMSVDQLWVEYKAWIAAGN